VISSQSHIRLLKCPSFTYTDTATTEIYTLSLHDALPISRACEPPKLAHGLARTDRQEGRARAHKRLAHARPRTPRSGRQDARNRSEEHTSELQSPYDLVCRLLLEKKKNRIKLQHVLLHP